MIYTAALLIQKIGINLNVHQQEDGYMNYHTYVLCRSLKSEVRASLVAQWLRICLPMQATRVRALLWEDPTCHGAPRPVSHNY